MDGTAQTLAEVVRWLVEDPEAVRVRERRLGRQRVLEVSVAAADMGAVIGREGRTADALRLLLQARGERDGEPYELRICEPEGR